MDPAVAYHSKVLQTWVEAAWTGQPSQGMLMLTMERAVQQVTSDTRWQSILTPAEVAVKSALAIAWAFQSSRTIMPGRFGMISMLKVAPKLLGTLATIT